MWWSSRLFAPASTNSRLNVFSLTLAFLFSPSHISAAPCFSQPNATSLTPGKKWATQLPPRIATRTKTHDRCTHGPPNTMVEGALGRQGPGGPTSDIVSGWCASKSWWPYGPRGWRRRKRKRRGKKKKKKKKVTFTAFSCTHLPLTTRS